MAQGVKQIYREWYFEHKYKYSKKKVIQLYYHDMLIGANRYSPWNLMNGQSEKSFIITKSTSGKRNGTIRLDNSQSQIKIQEEY